MSISLLLEMAQSGGLAEPDRTAIVSGELRMSVDELSELADGGAGVIAESGAQHVVYVGAGGAMLPLLLFAAARAAVPLTPLNYRLSVDGLRTLIARLPEPLVIVDDVYRDMVGDSFPVISSADFCIAAEAADPVAVAEPDPDAVAVVLFTSGTTSAPKAVELTHNNLTSYITGTVEFDSAHSGDAALICVPPYHIAAVSAALSNLYAGRKMVYQSTFDADEWVRLVDDEAVSSATVVPTMLDRIVTALEATTTDTTLPTLRTLAYGGSKVALPLLRKALALLPGVGFVNAYGLTETSSTIAVLTPEDHRLALASDDPGVLRRLGSVGRPVPAVEVQIRGEHGSVLGPNEPGELFVRGEQVSGRYTDIGSVLDADGWFPTRDMAYLDADGYLFIGGRSDDTIIRGGENIAPAEIEDVLVEHPQVRECAVVGAADPEWGQIIVAVVVPAPGADPDVEELRGFVRGQLRGSRTPDRIVFLDELPTTATGKVLRRELADELAKTEVESAWPTHPDYRIDVSACPFTGQVWAGEVLIAESDACLLVTETDHVDRLYFPAESVRWELFTPSERTTVCPFKGVATYWNLTAVEPTTDDVVWTYRTPLPEVAALSGHVSFYSRALRVLVVERWQDGTTVPATFPLWGDADELIRLIDVEPVAERHFVGPAHGPTRRDVVEGGQFAAQAIVAMTKTIAGQRVTSASLSFMKAASFTAPIDVAVDVLRQGRTFSTAEVRLSQNGVLRSVGLLLADSGAPDVIRDVEAMPDVVGPDDALPFAGFGMPGREIRVVDGAYDPDPDRVAAPRIDAWVRFREAPAAAHLHTALLAQSTTHWTIAAGMLPHRGFGEARAHRDLSTGIIKLDIAFHDEVDVTEWLLYSNRAFWAGRGLIQGDGRVFTREGVLAASYVVQAMVRDFDRDPASMGHDSRTAM